MEPDESPGLQPVWVGKILRSIASVSYTKKCNFVRGLQQLCAGQDAGCEAAVHVKETNKVSWKLLFHNSAAVCHAFSCYSEPSHFYGLEEYEII